MKMIMYLKNTLIYINTGIVHNTITIYRTTASTATRAMRKREIYAVSIARSWRFLCGTVAVRALKNIESPRAFLWLLHEEEVNNFHARTRGIAEASSYRNA